MKKISEHDLFDAIGNIDHKYIKSAENTEVPAAHEVTAETISNQSWDETQFALSADSVDSVAPMIVPSRVAKPVVNRIMPLLAVASIVLVFIAGAYAYKFFHKANDPKDPDKNDVASAAAESTTAIEVAISDTTVAPAHTTPMDPIEHPTDAAVGTKKLTIPEEVTKIVIQRGDLGKANYDSLTFKDSKTLQDIIAKLGEVSGEKVKYTAKLEMAMYAGQYSFSLNCYKNNTPQVSYYFFSDTTILVRSSIGFRAIEVDPPTSVLSYITSKMNNPEFVPDSPYDWANTQYLILEVGEPTGPWFISSAVDGKYIEVACKVIYGNITDIAITLSDQGNTRNMSVYNIRSFYISEKLLDEITSHDMILIRRARLSERIFPDAYIPNGDYCFIANDENGVLEYLAFDDGRLYFPESSSTDCIHSFASLYSLNEEVERLMGQDPQPGDIPRQKIYNGMTLQEVINYFEAFQNWAATVDQP